MPGKNVAFFLSYFEASVLDLGIAEFSSKEKLDEAAEHYEISGYGVKKHIHDDPLLIASIRQLDTYVGFVNF